ncbi:MAG: YraN family protein [Proteobacteria bacterium]|nr:YraN family protein [Pseudomonadota bacterium]
MSNHTGAGTMDNASAGRRAEELAERLLSGAGLAIIARNFRCRHGEIDLIAREGDTFVFCEVRLRTSSAFGGAAESITGRKQARIAAAARYFLTARPEAPCRFDVLLLQTLDLARVQWIRNAFTV